MSHPEILKIAEELCEMYEPNEWIAHYEAAIAAEPYNFVVLDRRRPITEDRWTVKFSKPFPPSKKYLQLKTLRENKK